MTLDRFVRVSIAVVVALVFVVAIAALLFISESALNVWDRLRAGPPFILYIYIGIMAILAIVAVWLIFRLVVKKKAAPEESARPLSKADIQRTFATGRRGGC